MMIIASVVSLLLSCAAFVFTTSNAPPAYTHLINQLLGAESDNGFVIESTIKSLKEKKTRLGDHLDLVHNVFRERKARNIDGATIDATKPRVLVRALEANQNDTDWYKHPLRWHALAEAYSMWAQGASVMSIARSNQTEIQCLRNKALELYQQVMDSRDWRATKLMKFSAEQNRGNIHLYAGNYSEAEKAYQSVLVKNRNLSSAGNLMAIYLMSQPPRIKECEELGIETRDWALSEGKAITEASPYSSLLCALGYAKLMQSQFKEGTDYLLEAYDITPDMLTALNLAVSLILEKRPKDALKILDRQKQPTLTADSQQEVSKLQPASLTYYLIRGLAMSSDKPADKLAHYLLYLERPTIKADIERFTQPNYHAEILQDALTKLKGSNGSDKDFLLIPGFSVLFELPNPQ